MRRERECKGCDGTGCSVHETPSRAHRFYLGCDCPACLGTGRVTDHIPAADAVADAETFYRILVPLAASCSEARRRVNGVLRATDLCWRVRTAHDATIGRNGTYMGVYMARAAFRAVPGLRG